MRPMTGRSWIRHEKDAGRSVRAAGGDLGAAAAAGLQPNGPSSLRRGRLGRPRGVSCCGFSRARRPTAKRSARPGISGRRVSRSIRRSRATKIRILGCRRRCPGLIWPAARSSRTRRTWSFMGRSGRERPIWRQLWGFWPASTASGPASSPRRSLSSAYRKPMLSMGVQK